MPKVLISDPLAPEGLEILERARGIEVINAPDLDQAELLEAIRDVEGLLVRSGTQVTAEVLEAAEKLKVIGRAGVGVDNVDVAAASKRGVVVVNTPGGNTITTAEHAIALLVSLARHVPQATASMKSGKWEKKKFKGIELYNRTLGVVGLGNVGRIVADRARGLGMRVIAFDPHISAEVAQKHDVELLGFDELLGRADAITIHVPRSKETLGLLGREAFEKVRPGVLIVNAARGGIVDEEALAEALESGQVGGAALDVFAEEPPPTDHPLLAHGQRDLHASPGRIDRAGPGQRLHHRGGAGPRLSPGGCGAQRRQRTLHLAGASRAGAALPGARREARALPGAALSGCHRGDRDRVRRRGRRSARGADHRGGAQGHARVGQRSRQHGERADHRPGARNQGDRVEVEPRDRLRQHRHHPGARAVSIA